MRGIVTIAFVFSSTQALLGQTYLLEGQISSGTTLFTANEPWIGTGFNELGYPKGGYPVPYIAVLLADVEKGFWEFSFRTTDDVEKVVHVVDGPSEADLGTTSQLLVNSDRVSIEFFRFSGVSTLFSLDLDLEQETGSWEWVEDCPVCDLVFAMPSAVATVSSIQIVPEPSGNLLVFCVAFAVTSAARLRKLHLFGRP